MSHSPAKGVRLSLPATSANLGPGFDAAGLALSMHLSIEAHPSPTWQIHATGRDSELCGAIDHNLIVDTYRDVMQRHHRAAASLKLVLHNEIPLGMGCGSSAAAICAGVSLADHFGSLKLGDAGIVAEATRIEGHPDNVAACWLGGFTVSAQTEQGVATATFGGDPAWDLLLVMQASALATKKSRTLLPESYTKSDAVFNVQRASLLVAAFAQGRLDLLRTATEDRIHQPYRCPACPLLEALLPLAEEPEIAGLALSGAGPSVLVFLAEGTTLLEGETRIRSLVPPEAEVVPVRIATGAMRTELA